MPTPHITKQEAERRIAAVNKALSEGYRPPGVMGHGQAAVSKAASSLGMARTGVQNSLHDIRRLYGLEPDWSLWKHQEAPIQRVTYGPDVDFHAAIKAALRRGTKSLPELSNLTGLPEAVCGAIIHDLTDKGANVRADGGSYSIEKEPPQAYTAENIPEYVGRKDNTFLFGAISDTHLGSKYERLDVLNWEYDRFAKAKVDRVFHAGNMIDGECRFNKFDIHTHGMDAQCQYLAKHYPIRKGLVTYAVSGDDHEGWYAQREGVDIGRYIENVMKEGGRSDWVNLGYMESHIKLVNPNTGKFAILAVVHPGGGSSYADSYTVQKIIESLEGGEKPAVGLYGHYHKLLAGSYRNVWWLQTGCTKDQDTFARKKKLRYDIGGTIVELTQDPVTGAIIGFTPKMMRYFNRGYYNDRWSLSGDVTLPPRTVV